MSGQPLESSSEDEAPPDADPPSPGLVSHAESAAPPPAGQQISAQQLSDHPVWQASRGQGPPPPRAGGPPRGARRPASDAGDAVNPARFERISMAELEAKQFADGDGADSAIQSDDEEDDWTRVRPAEPKSHRKKKQRADGPRNLGRGERNEDGDDDDDDDDDSGDSGDDGRRRDIAGLMGAAAFGGGSHYRAGGSDAGSIPSEQSSLRRRDAMRQAFPVRGVTCVGCALTNRIGPVNRFVKDNISQMTEDALVQSHHALSLTPAPKLTLLARLLLCQWKMAALCYKREVAEPAEREGAVVPKWGWKEASKANALLLHGSHTAFFFPGARALRAARHRQLRRAPQDDPPAAVHALAAGAASCARRQRREGAGQTGHGPHAEGRVFILRAHSDSC